MQCEVCRLSWSSRSDGIVASTNCPYVVRLLRICHLFLNVHSPCSYMQLRCLTATRKMALRWKPQCRKTQTFPRGICCAVLHLPKRLRERWSRNDSRASHIVAQEIHWDCCGTPGVAALQSKQNFPRSQWYRQYSYTMLYVLHIGISARIKYV